MTIRPLVLVLFHSSIVSGMWGGCTVVCESFTTPLIETLEPVESQWNTTTSPLASEDAMTGPLWILSPWRT